MKNHKPKMDEQYYRHLMTSNKKDFLDMLNKNILKGGEGENETKTQLAVMSTHCDHKILLRDFRDTDGDSLIHNVVKFYESTDILKRLLVLCPELILAKRSGRFAGQTALHIVIAKENLSAAKVILTIAKKRGSQFAVLHAKAKNSISSNIATMGELALSMAALTLNMGMVDLLIQYQARISEQNSLKDNVFHSLIRCAKIHPEKVKRIVEMIEHINKKVPDDQIGNVWYSAENMDNLTPLKLAAHLGQVEIFSKILTLENVYCKVNIYNRLFDIYLFDITEIDTITQAGWERGKEREKKRILEKSKDDFEQAKEEDMIKSQSSYPSLRHKSPAVLDIICSLPSKTAFQFVNVEVVRDIIIAKWSRYEVFYYLWLFWHFLNLFLITVYAVYKTDVINDRIYDTGNSTQSYATTQHTERFVYFMSCWGFVFAIPYIVYEFIRTLHYKQPWHFKVLHHNALYRMMLLVMSFSLILDSVWFWIEPDNNYFLIVALLVGWTFMVFFLRTRKTFSFYTVMLQKVLLGDMTRFSVFIIFQLISFSLAMHITFLNTRPVPSGFENIGKSTMTMFKLMLGLGEIDVLYDARHPWVAIFLFVFFVLATYVLMINSLIALMSQTCALMSDAKQLQWELQVLSVLHLVETMLPPRWRYEHKPDLQEGRYEFDDESPDRRYFSEITTFKTIPTEVYGSHLWEFLEKNTNENSAPVVTDVDKRTAMTTYVCKRTQTDNDTQATHQDDNSSIINVAPTLQSPSHSLADLELTTIPN